MLPNNGLVNQNDVMKLNWLFKAKEDIPFQFIKYTNKNIWGPICWLLNK